MQSQSPSLPQAPPPRVPAYRSVLTLEFPCPFHGASSPRRRPSSPRRRSARRQSSLRPRPCTLHRHPFITRLLIHVLTRTDTSVTDMLAITIVSVTDRLLPSGPLSCVGEGSCRPRNWAKHLIVCSRSKSTLVHYALDKIYIIRMRGGGLLRL